MCQFILYHNTPHISIVNLYKTLKPIAKNSIVMSEQEFAFIFYLLSLIVDLAPISGV